MTRLACFALPVLIVGCDGSGTQAPQDSEVVEVATPTLDEAAEPEAEAEPEPEAEPEAEAEPEPEPELVSWGHADLDPDNDNILGPPEPLADCEAQLEAAGVSYSDARIGVGKKRDGVYTCGAHQVVRFKRGPGKIAYSKNPLLTCTMALALADFEKVAQEEAERIMGSRIKTIEHMGTYNCREMANFDMLSEHSFANGIDLKAFTFKNGQSLNVLDNFEPTVADPDDPKTLFLRSLANRLYDEQVFSVVVTPHFDYIHRNHIHVDLARYRVDGSRP